MLVVDIGGTFIKYALTDERGAIISDSVAQVPSDATDSYEGFVRALSGIIAQADERQTVTKACVSIAGPFDFDAGVSHMQHKLKGLYQKSLRPVFENAGISVDFLHDSTAFLLGEAYDGVLTGKPSPCCVMLGTGLGFAFMREGRVCVNDKRTPAFTLWNAPWKDGVAEDYVSTRAIQGLYGDNTPVKQIAELARQGDAKAVQAFKTIGARLSELLAYLMPRLHCDCLALGGQIARAAELFELALPIAWSVSHHIDDAALRGASYYALHGRTACERVLISPFMGDSEVRI